MEGLVSLCPEEDRWGFDEREFLGAMIFGKRLHGEVAGCTT